MAIDRLRPGVHVGFGDFQDVVWHIAWRSGTVTDLPPLLPVVNHLQEGAVHYGMMLSGQCVEIPYLAKAKSIFV